MAASREITNKTDVLVIGGGITGAGILRELALHGLSTVLLEKSDFSGQTSQGSSKMLHGGIRYLENLDFSLVFEALREKNIWLKLTPHLCYPQTFYMPSHKLSKYPKIALFAAVKLYHALSLFKDGRSGVCSRGQFKQLFPLIDDQNINGGAFYSDAIVDDARLCIECILDACTYPNIEAHNYIEVKSITKKADNYSVVYFDHQTQLSSTIQAKHVVFATGPFTDHIMQTLKIDWEPVLIPSKGTHIWIKADKLKMSHPMVLQTQDNRVVFVIPQKGAILVGTTEIELEKAEFDIKPSQVEIDYLIKQLNIYFPKAMLDGSDIISSFAAIRPLVGEHGRDRAGKVSRHHQIYRPQKNMYAIVGGKYTTFRIMAQDVVKLILPSFNISFNPGLSLNEFKYQSQVKPFEQLTNSQLMETAKNDEFAVTSEDIWRRRLGLISSPK
jgi:glycerol-3-phosphate dehydrogenase